MAIKKAYGRAFIIGSSMDEVVGTIGKIEHDREDMSFTSITVCHMVSEIMYQSEWERL